MRDLRSHRVIIFKAFLFLFLGLMAVGLLLWESPTLRTGALLAIAIWAFARAYYFAFYVIEHYLDPTFRFSGLVSAVRFLCTRHGRP